MYSTKFHLISIGIVVGFSLLGHVGLATAQAKIRSVSQSSDDIDIDKLARALRQQLNSMKEVFGDDPNEVGRQIMQTSRMLEDARSLSDQALQRAKPRKSLPANRDDRQEAIRLPDCLMNWPMPKRMPRNDHTDPVRAFDFTPFDFSALEKSLEFPQLKRSSLTK